MRVSNHPVHFETDGGDLSPSAFIPFCEFGGNMSAMGVKIDQFAVPVCNSFKEKILNDQLCYEIDLNKYSNKDNIKRELDAGFVFLMDYNEERQVGFEEEFTSADNDSFTTKIIESDHSQHAAIYLNTIGKNMSMKMLFLNSESHFRTIVISWRR